MIGELLNLVRWEWFKQGPRWMPWILLSILLLFSQLAVWGTFFSYRSLQASGGEVPYAIDVQNGRQGPVPTVSCNDLRAGRLPQALENADRSVLDGLLRQCEQAAARQQDQLTNLRGDFSLPGSSENALGSSQMFGLILVAIFTASVIGMEYSLGTLRPILARGPGRWQYLSAKFLLLIGCAAGALLLVSAATAVSSLAANGFAGPLAEGSVSTSWADVLATLGKTWFSLVPYIALTVLATVLSKSAATGMAIGLGYFFAEQIAVALLSNLFDWFGAIADYLLARNISAFSGAFSFGGQGARGPGELQAFLVLVAYLVCLGGAAFWLFLRRDVTGASGA